MDEETLSKRDRKKINKQAKLQAESEEVSKKSMKNKLLVVFGIIAAAAFVWFGFFNNPGETPGNTQQDSSQVAESSSQDHTKGPEDALLTMIEYGDYQCPACAAYYPITKQLAEEHKDTLKVVFRNFPLRSLHKNAQVASQAAEAAGLQDKFWEMHDKLYEEQENWSSDRDPKSLFEGYAADIGLDLDKFKSDFDSQEVRDRINTDYNGAFAAGVNATPTFFLNGERLDNPRGYEPFKKIIEEKISELEAMFPQDTPEATLEGEIPEASM